MATIKKRGTKYQVQVNKLGVRRSASFETKIEAREWAAEIESGVKSGKYNKIPDKTFGDLLIKYRDSESKLHRGHTFEARRINATLKLPIANVPLRTFNEVHVADWKDERLQTVSAGTILRDWNLFSSAASMAVREWKWLERNPFKNVKRPEKPLARTRRISPDEITRICDSGGYYGGKPETLTATACVAFLFSIETAMRAGEIIELTWSNVFDKHVHLPRTKNGTARDVPLSVKARELLKYVKGLDETLVFGLTSTQLDSLFRKVKKRCLIDDLHFHDARAEALTRLSKKLDVLSLAKLSGHKDVKMLLDCYYRPTAGEVADLLG
jgi:integrase